MSSSELNKAKMMIEQGEASQARMVIQGILRQDAYNVDAWWLLIDVARDDDEKRRAVNHILKLNPTDAKAQNLLMLLNEDDTQDVSMPSIAELMSQPKPKNDNPFDDSLWQFDTPSTQPVKRTPKPQKSSRLLIVGATLMILLFGVIATLLAGLDSLDSFETIVEPEFEIINQTVTIEPNGRAEIKFNHDGFVRITAEGRNGADPVIYVFDHDGIEITYNDDNNDMRGLDTFDAGIELVRVYGSTTLEITEYWDDGGEVEVTIETVSLSDLNTNNLEFGQSTEVYIDESAWFTLTLNSEQTFDVTVISQDSDFDPVVAIYDADFRLIAENDDHNTNNDLLDVLDSVVEDVELSGTIYIQVMDFGGYGDGDVIILVK